MNERVMDALAVIALIGAAAITYMAPFLTEEEGAAEPVKKYSAKINVDLDVPDCSGALEIAENRQKALEVINAAQAIFDRIDTVDPEIVIPPTLTYVGNFYITMYAATTDQCGNDLGITASGKKVTEDPLAHTIAVDPKVIPLGTKVMIDLPGYEDVIFEAADTGGDIKNYWIDVYTDDIPLSYSFNPTYADVWIVEEN